jgi:hypothetical protein
VREQGLDVRAGDTAGIRSGGADLGVHNEVIQGVLKQIAAGASARDAGHRHASGDIWAAFNMGLIPALGVPVGTDAYDCPIPA